MAAHKHTPERRSSKGKGYQIRNLKVRQKQYTRIVKDRHHRTFDRTLFSTVPWISLQGQWLDRAGFSIHTPIKVWVLENCLVLTVEG